MQKFGTVTIDARRYRDRTYGNTYHSVSVYVDGVLVGVEPYTYGYGDQWKQTAHTLLQKAGMFLETGERLQSGMDKDYYDFENYVRDHRNKFVMSVVDVARKSDLHEGGKGKRITYSVSGSKNKSKRKASGASGLGSMR